MLSSESKWGGSRRQSRVLEDDIVKDGKRFMGS